MASSDATGQKSTAHRQHGVTLTKQEQERLRKSVKRVILRNEAEDRKRKREQLEDYLHELDIYPLIYGSS